MGSDRDNDREHVVSRRNFIYAAASSAAVSLPLQAQERPQAAEVSAEPPLAYPLKLHVNGQQHALSLDPRTTLLDAIRDGVGLTGTKKGCGHGQCGACTVHVDGRRVLSCMMFAAMAAGREITTIEGLARPGAALHPMQQAFIDQDAFQCGYCTPGQIMAAIACVREGHAGSPAEIREYMSGNLCRCAAYPNIVAAIEQARAATAAA
jgi:xanthine dehydrogenase YagT iron-sulfur-binding subunit